jgi:hypothetical protein
MIEASHSYMSVLSPVLAKIPVRKPDVVLAEDTLRMALWASAAYISAVRMTNASKNVRISMRWYEKTGVRTTFLPSVFRKAKT